MRKSFFRAKQAEINFRRAAGTFSVGGFSRATNCGGQGLIETITAIGVIATGLIAAISLVIANMAAQREAAMRYQAMNFAREGIEVVRSIRDNNWIAGQDAWYGIPEADARLPTRMVPFINPRTLSMSLFTSGSSRIYIRRDTGTFEQHSNAAVNADPTPFTRDLTLSFLDCGPETVPCADIPDEENRTAVALEVTARIEWTDRGNTRHVELIETLYDWR